MTEGKRPDLSLRHHFFTGSERSEESHATFPGTGTEAGAASWARRAAQVTLERVAEAAHSAPAPLARETGAARFAARAERPWVGAASLCGLATLAATLFFFHLGSYGLWEPDEARYAEIAREMLSTGDFILPRLNYVAYVEKPPLLYWLTATSFGALGHSELAARIVPAVSALLGVLATYLFALKVFDRRRALLAGGILATAPLYTTMAQVLTTDMLLTALVTVALFAFFLSWSEGGGWRWLFYVAMGLGTLAKGPVAIVIPMLVAIVFLAWRRELKGAGARFRPLLGLVLTFAIAAPWFLAVAMREPDFVRFYFFGEHIRRFFEANFSHGEPFYFYIPVVVVGFLPWSILFPVAGSGATANRDARDFCLIAATVILVFFSLASAKLIPYILPALPPLAVAIADSALGLEPSEGAGRGAYAAARRRLKLAAPILMGLLGAAMVVAAIAARSLPEPYPLVVRPALFACGTVMLVGAGLIGVAFARRLTEAALAIGVLTMAAAMLAGSYARLEAEPFRSYTKLSREVAARAPDATLICYHRYVQALAFYGKRRVVLVGLLSELDFGRQRSADASAFFLRTDDDLMRLWNAPGSKVIVIDESDLRRLEPRFGEFIVIASEATKRAILRPEGRVGRN